MTKALMKYQRRLLAERDAEIYRTTSDDPDVEAWVAHRVIPSSD